MQYMQTYSIYMAWGPITPSNLQISLFRPLSPLPLLKSQQRGHKKIGKHGDEDI